jgi:hypothetical protein
VLHEVCDTPFRAASHGPHDVHSPRTRPQPPTPPPTAPYRTAAPRHGSFSLPLLLLLLLLRLLRLLLPLLLLLVISLPHSNLSRYLRLFPLRTQSYKGQKTQTVCLHSSPASFLSPSLERHRQFPPGHCKTFPTTQPIIFVTSLQKIKQHLSSHIPPLLADKPSFQHAARGYPLRSLVRY